MALNTFRYEVRCYPKDEDRPIVIPFDSLGQARARATNLRDSDTGRQYRKIIVWGIESTELTSVGQPVFVAKS